MNSIKLYNHKRPNHTDIALLFSDFSARFERFERHWFSRPNHTQRVFFSTFLDLLMTILARTPKRGVPQKQVKCPKTKIPHLPAYFWDIHTLTQSMSQLSVSLRRHTKIILLVIILVVSSPSCEFLLSMAAPPFLGRMGFDMTIST